MGRYDYLYRLEDLDADFPEDPHEFSAALLMAAKHHIRALEVMKNDGLSVSNFEQLPVNTHHISSLPNPRNVFVTEPVPSHVISLNDQVKLFGSRIHAAIVAHPKTPEEIRKYLKKQTLNQERQKLDHLCAMFGHYLFRLHLALLTGVTTSDGVVDAEHCWNNAREYLATVERGCMMCETPGLDIWDRRSVRSDHMSLCAVKPSSAQMDLARWLKTGLSTKAAAELNLEGKMPFRGQEIVRTAMPAICTPARNRLWVLFAEQREEMNPILHEMMADEAVDRWSDLRGVSIDMITDIPGYDMAITEKIREKHRIATVDGAESLDFDEKEYLLKMRTLYDQTQLPDGLGKKKPYTDFIREASVDPVARRAFQLMAAMANKDGSYNLDNTYELLPVLVEELLIIVEKVGDDEASIDEVTRSAYLTLFNSAFVVTSILNEEGTDSPYINVIQCIILCSIKDRSTLNVIGSYV